MFRTIKPEYLRDVITSNDFNALSEMPLDTQVSIRESILELLDAIDSWNNIKDIAPWVPPEYEYKVVTGIAFIKAEELERYLNDGYELIYAIPLNHEGYVQNILRRERKQ